MTDREKLARQWAELSMRREVLANKYDDTFLSEEERAAAEHILATTEPELPELNLWDGVEILGREWVVWSVGETGSLGLLAADGGAYTHDFAENTTPNGKRYELREVIERVEPSTKTMDEYSPVERADMVGMWAGYNRHVAGGKPTDFVIITGEETEAGRVPCYNPGAPTPHAWAPDKWMLTPRFDMPRAWGKDGEPCEPTVSFGENVGVDQPDHPEVLETEEDYENAPEGTVVGRRGGIWAKDKYGDWRTLGALTSRLNRHMSDTTRRVLRWGWGE